jgi:hypothetical protein
MLGLRSSRSSAFNQHFQTGSLSLVEGQHLTPASRNAVLVSQAFAAQNSLYLGDTVTANLNQEFFSRESEDADVQEGELLAYAAQESGQEALLTVTPREESYIKPTSMDFFTEYRNMTPQSIQTSLTLPAILLVAGLVLAVVILSILLSHARVICPCPKKSAGPVKIGKR